MSPGGKRKFSGRLPTDAREQRRSKMIKTKAKEKDRRREERDRAARWAEAWDAACEPLRANLIRLKFTLKTGTFLLPEDHGLTLTPLLETKMVQQTQALIMLYTKILEAGVDYTVSGCAQIVLDEIGELIPSIGNVRKLQDINASFLKNGYLVVDMRGRQQRKLLLDNTELRDRLSKFVKENAQKKGALNMTVESCTHFVNGTGPYKPIKKKDGSIEKQGLFSEYSDENTAKLLAYYRMHTGVPCFGMETVRLWLKNSLGAVFVEHSKNIFYDGHDTPENKEYCREKYAPAMIAMYRRAHLWKAFSPDSHTLKRYQADPKIDIPFTKVFVRPPVV